MAFREIWLVLWRNRLLIVACVAVAGALGVFFAARAVAVYRSEVVIRIEEPLQLPTGFEGIRRGPEADLIESDVEELQTRSLAAEVASELGLQVRVVEPPGALRAEVLSAVEAPRHAATAEYRMVRTPDQQFAVEAAPTGRVLGSFAPGEPVPLADEVVVVLSPAAVRHEQLRLEIRSFEKAVEEVHGEITVSRPNRDANVIRVSYEHPDPSLARDVPNALATRFLERRQQARAEEAQRALRQLAAQLAALRGGLPVDDDGEPLRVRPQPEVLADVTERLQTRLLEASVAEVLRDPGGRIIDPAVLPREPVRPRRSLIVGIAVFLGGVLGIGAAFVRGQFDRSIYTRREVQHLLQVPVLGLIPRIPHSYSLNGHAPQGTTSRLRWRRGRAAPLPAVSKDPDDAASEAYRALRTHVVALARQDRRRLRTLLITSPDRGEGKTTSAANLALIVAQQRLRVLLVDADLRRGDLAALLGKERQPGLADLLLGAAELETAIRRIPLAEGAALDFLAGGAAVHPAELLGSPSAVELFGRLRDQYDVIFFDSPPLGAFTDAAVLAIQVDGVLLVARAGHTAAESLSHAMEQLESLGAPVVGVILNDVRKSEMKEYYRR